MKLFSGVSTGIFAGSGEVVVVEGDVQLGSWDYGSLKNQLKGWGTFIDPKIDFSKEVTFIRKISGPEAMTYLNKGRYGFGKSTKVAGAAFGGVIGVALGIYKSQKKADALTVNDVSCFEIRLQSGKRFIALSYPVVFDTILIKNPSIPRQGC